MIVSDPPYDLVALFADQDAMFFFSEIINRGVERACLGPLRWRPIVDPYHDTLCRQPERELKTYLRMNCRLLLIWDHAGSGLESQQPFDTERQVVERLEKCGVAPERVLALALAPELETIPVTTSFASCCEYLFAIRGNQPRPTKEAILRYAQRTAGQEGVHFPSDFQEASAAFPKEILHALIRVCGLRPSAALYRDPLGKQLTISRLKSHPAFQRLTDWLKQCFPSPSSGLIAPTS